MAIHYPNGKKFNSQPKATINGSKKQESFSNRGMTLEEDINETNEYYLAHGMAVIHKKPTPLQIVKVDYPHRSAAVIKEAYFRQPSTTDYNGVFLGKHLDFEAKETRNKTSFPLKNFHDHQINHMRHVLAHQGICFVLLRFSSADEVFLLDASHLISYYENQKSARKSIPKKEIESLGHPVKTGFHPRIDYLKVVQHIYF
ncbi:Holliday junction resolvase RecU [Bacillus alkalicellulosilyticus]|uniref:Holliday junction resolvase RecU n=1 Tax=Alkalihalobacterium alkalicellulosilyticum TaxID=1912214 RepID=UPI000997AF02|nr:Holliday junction resolvase RecU [Bacillus alkalicellulosilyticus]